MLSAVTAVVDGQSPSEKLIYYGWDTLNEQQAENAMPHLKHLSFDGLTVRNRLIEATMFGTWKFQ